MKDINTYEDFLNMTLKEYGEFCHQLHSAEVISKVYSFYKRAKQEGVKMKTTDEENKLNKKLKDIFGIK